MILKKIIKLFRNFICCIGLIVIFPFLALAMLAVIFEDGLPIFFIQERIGERKINFKIIKIRTLKNNAPNLGTHELKESFVLNCGRWIRKLKLDEFPQLINVLKGDLNLVGPRPGLVSQEELFKERVSRNIYQVKPGITGLAQIFGYDMSEPSMLARIDEIYILNRSLKVDILILLGTFISYPKKILKTMLDI